jgi:hypothetical protein
MKIFFLGSLLLSVVCLASCKPKDLRASSDAGSALGSVLAEETIRAIGANKTVVILTQESKGGGESSAESEFKKVLKKNGVAIAATVSPNLGDPMHYGEFGLHANDFLQVIQKHGSAGAIVSFIGAPLLPPSQLANIPAHPPIFVVAVSNLGEVPGVTGNPAMLPALFQAKVIQLAILDGAAPGNFSVRKSDDAHQLFAQKFQILRVAESNVH